MLKSYIKIGFRSLSKNKAFSIINIMGLSIGVAACLLILQYVSFELGFDRFHENGQDIYRVVNDRYQNGKLIQHGTITYSAVGKAMNDDFEEIIANARILPATSTVVRRDDVSFITDAVLAVDNSFLQMFTFDFLAGNNLDALKEPNKVVLTKTAVDRIFGTTSDLSAVLGKTFQIDRDAVPYEVTAIIADVPANTHLPFEILISYETVIRQWAVADYDFNSSDFYHYMQLKPGTDVNLIQKELSTFSDRHFRGTEVTGTEEKFYLQPLHEARLYSDFEYEIGEVGNGRVVWALLIIAIFILVIAWVNYINLATAKAMDRAKEVGVRKVLGAYKIQLIKQFLSESLLINLLAIVMAITFVQLTQPFFNVLIGRQLSLMTLLGSQVLGINIVVLLAGLMALGTVLSGLYPAFVLSSFMPVKVLKGKHATSKEGIMLRRILVVFQFVVSISLIGGSYVVYKQIRFMNEKELGVDIDQMLVVSSPQLTAWDSTFIERVVNFKESVKQISGIKGATSSWRVPGQLTPRAFRIKRTASTDNVSYSADQIGVNYEFFDLYDIEVLAGRGFEPSDHNYDWNQLENMVINKAAANMLGFESPQDAIGESVSVYDKPWTVVGVVDDYHQKSLRHKVLPTILFPTYSTGSPISIKLTSSEAKNAIALIQERYKAYFPGNAFEYYFLDSQFNQLYRLERLFGQVFGIFTALAILVACLGLSGLASFAAIQRTKEIGIRKALGASAIGILRLLSSDFVRLIAIATIIALPLAYWGLKAWLSNYAYHISLEWWFTLIPILTVFIIAFTTVSFQTVKAALSSPIKALRQE
ncbi:MAG: ABC transporter permease [Bacteroidota bacterium]